MARIPVLLMLFLLGLCAHVAIAENQGSEVLVAGLPLGLVLVAYVRAGRGARGGRGTSGASAPGGGGGDRS